MQTVADYARYLRRLRDAMGPHIQVLLKAGLSVVARLPGQHAGNRQWMRGLFEVAGRPPIACISSDVTDAVCKQRLHRRNAAGAHEFAVSGAEFDGDHQLTSWRQTAAEGFSR